MKASEAGEAKVGPVLEDYAAEAKIEGPRIYRCL